MKKQLLILTSFALSALTISATTTADFETLTLNAGSYWAGSSTAVDTSFSSGNANFPNKNNGWWEQGWAYSNVMDSTTVGYTNNYGSRAGSGYNQSSNYAVGKAGAKVILAGESVGQPVEGMYVSNGTYAALSMKEGDDYAKKFGGADGNDQDWFLLTVKGYSNGLVVIDSVNFYLADFRFSDNAQDYVIKDWRWVDLTSLGNVDSLVFKLNSSDVGLYGMNTPSYFCMDNLKTAGSPTSVSENNLTYVHVYPNPARNVLNVNGVSKGASAQIVDLAGKIIQQKVVTSSMITFDVSGLNTGMYVLNLIENGKLTQRKFVK
jgi:hypothetical protein